MAWAYNKNSILTNKGNVDYFCLACESYLKSDDEVETHIRSLPHKGNLDALPYMEDYKDDHLRKAPGSRFTNAYVDSGMYTDLTKVKKGYYCEYCNILFKMPALLGLHVIEQSHIDNRQTKSMERNSSSIVYKDILIEEKSWNCIIDETCMICMSEFDDVIHHMKDPGHVINLIQSNIEFGKQEMIYRKINNTSFQCLTCNRPLALSNLNSHPYETEHQEKYEACRQAYAKTKQNEDKKNKKPKEEPKASKSETKVAEEPVSQKKNATEKKPDKYVNKKENLSLKSVEEEVCSILGAVNYITKDENDLFWCVLCDWSFPDARGHLSGRHHSIILSMHQDRELKRTGNKPVPSVSKPQPHKQQSDPDNISNILESLTKFQANNMKLDFENETAFCKKCNKNVEFDFVAVNKHIEEHVKPVKEIQVKKTEQKARKNSEASSTSKDDEEELANIVEQHQLTPANKGKMYCKYCEIYLSVSLKNLKDHVNGNSHKNKMLKLKSKKLPMNGFVQQISGIRDGGVQIVVNEKYCVNVFSHNLVTKDYKMRCEVCEVDLEMSQFSDHARSESHGTAVGDTQVLVTLEEEFVREINSTKYHCGYCNIVTDSFEALELHLGTIVHSEAKNVATWRLQQYLPKINIERKTGVNNFIELLYSGNEQWF